MESESHTTSSKRVRNAAIVGGVLALVGVGCFWAWSRAHESTDNAFFEGHIVQVSPRVAGQVLRVYVNDNQYVKRGELLAEIDPADYEARLMEARGRLAEIDAREHGAQSGLEMTSTVTSAVLIQATAGTEVARHQAQALEARVKQDAAGVEAATAGLRQAEARVAAADAEARRAGADAERYRVLYQKEEISRQLYDRAETEAKSAAANLDAAHQAAASARSQLDQARAGLTAGRANLALARQQVVQADGRLKEARSGPSQVNMRQADVRTTLAGHDQAAAVVHQAELSLSYTKIYAAESGYVTKKSVEPGNFVGAGQALMGIVSDRLWVVANFKETQLRHMRPGQPVSVKVDAYPQLKLRGMVESIQSGTGARFSLLPAENATGNYVKVVQRVPVKIVLLDKLPGEYRLGPGMSVEPEVTVR
jgi:membrane fusion protein (multidrug efflux system)